MRIGIYDRFWTTAGGGEKYAASLAEALGPGHQLYLLANEPVDWAMLDERLGTRLASFDTHVFPDEGPGSLAIATRRYDLLVNCSWLSSDPGGGLRNAYVVLFPTPWDFNYSWKQRLATRVLGSYVSSDVGLQLVSGFYPVEFGRLRRYRWLAERAGLTVSARENGSVAVSLVFAPRPPAAGPAEVKITLDGERVDELMVDTQGGPFTSTFRIPGRSHETRATISIETTPSFVPRDVFGPSVQDVRRLGVRLCGLLVGDGVRARLRARHPILALPPVDLNFLDTYEQVVSISEFTREHVRRLWGRESELLYPGVEPFPEATKEPLILSVGRFFHRTAGHSKKQLELVRAFRRLVERGLTGWDYHLVGGCAPEHVEYLELVRREAEGLPVHFHVDAAGATVRDLFARASIFWHATGLGESERRPHRFEHFGISTVEAMSAGAVPLVVGKAGQREIVEPGVSGFHFDSIDELVKRTWELAADDALRARISAGARTRARAFAPERFAASAREILLRPLSTHG